MTQKEKAIEILKNLGIYKPYIEEFQKTKIVTNFVNYAGFYVNPQSELADKISWLEQEVGGLVFAAIQGKYEFGECFSLLYIPEDESEWDDVLIPCGKEYYVFAYVWNVDDDLCSEFGDILIDTKFGGIKRIG